MKKFDFAIGNPPYQEETENNGRQTPVYNKFMDEAYKIAECVELITPGRFLFDAGQTPKTWNEKMLNDEHFKVIQYESDASKIFQNTEIKGGVAITLRNEKKSYGSIGIFTEFEELNLILHKVIQKLEEAITDICIGAVPYHFSNMLKEEHPEYADLIGSSFDLRTNIFEKLSGILFFEKMPNQGEYVKIYGLKDKERISMWVESKYVTTPENFGGYKVLLSKANGSGKFGETFSKPIISQPNSGHTQSFISIGNFNTKEEALNLQKYIKTKFARALLSVLKTTQDITPYKWKWVPVQDFTKDSDISWGKSVSEIDKQLYKKYGLSNDEIEFIETHVKEME